jgi:hypothetical protein
MIIVCVSNNQKANREGLTCKGRLFSKGVRFFYSRPSICTRDPFATQPNQKRNTTGNQAQKKETHNIMATNNTTTNNTASLEAQLAALRAENESLKASKSVGQTTVVKGAPSIKAGLVHFSRIGGLTGISLNPESFKALRANFDAACRLFDSVGEERMMADYAARPAFVQKGRR